MTTLNIVNNPSGTGNFAGSSIYRNKFLPPVSPRFIWASSKPEIQAFEKAKESIKHGDDQAEEVVDNVKDKATSISTANQVTEKAKGTTDKATSTGQVTLSEKAKQVWETAIEKAKETVLGKTDDSKDIIKEN